MSKKNIMKVNKKLFIILAIVVLYFVVGAIIMAYHEPWRDEAQAWLIVRDSSPFELFARLRTEGHPMLWYLVLMPFAKLGLPYITMGIISLLIMSVTMFLFLKWAPFGKLVKAMVLPSSMFLYYYPNIARSYCLIALLVVVVGVFYKDRLLHPIRYALALALLAQTHVLVLGLVGILYLCFGVELWRKKMHLKNVRHKKAVLWALVIPIVSALVVFVTLVGTSNPVAARDPISRDLIYTKLKFDVDVISFPAEEGGWILVTEAVLVLCAAFLLFRPKLFLVLGGSVGFYTLVNIFMYSSGATHKPVILLYFLMLVAWMAYYEKTTPWGNYKNNQYVKLLAMPAVTSAVFGLWCATTMPRITRDAKLDISEPYSASKIGGPEIDRSTSNGAIIVSTKDYVTSTFVPYLTKGQETWSLKNKEYFTYVDWAKGTGYEMPTPDEILQTIDAELPKDRPIYILACGWEEGFEERHENKIRGTLDIALPYAVMEVENDCKLYDYLSDLR